MRIPFLHEQLVWLVPLSSIWIVARPKAYAVLKTFLMNVITAFRYLVLKPFSFITGKSYEWHVTHYLLEFFGSETHSINYLK